MNIKITPVASSVPFDKSIDGMFSDNCQTAIEEAKGNQFLYEYDCQVKNPSSIGGQSMIRFDFPVYWSEKFIKVYRYPDLDTPVDFNLLLPQWTDSPIVYEDDESPGDPIPLCDVIQFDESLAVTADDSFHVKYLEGKMASRFGFNLQCFDYINNLTVVSDMISWSAMNPATTFGLAIQNKRYAKTLDYIHFVNQSDNRMINYNDMRYIDGDGILWSLYHLLPNQVFINEITDVDEAFWQDHIVELWRRPIQTGNIFRSHRTLHPPRIIQVKGNKPQKNLLFTGWYNYNPMRFKQCIYNSGSNKASKTIFYFRLRRLSDNCVGDWFENKILYEKMIRVKNSTGTILGDADLIRTI
jgi:hypothetical protein